MAGYCYIIGLIIIVICLNFRSVDTKIIHVRKDDTRPPRNAAEEQAYLTQNVHIHELSLQLARANYSQAQGLPKYTIQAEVEQEKAKQAKAHNEYLASQFPFEHPKSRYNLGYIGRGYDVFHGNPLPDQGVIDRGFRLPVLELKYTSKVSADGQYKIPDNVDVIAEPSATFSSSLHEVSTVHDYQHMLSSHAKVSASAGFMSFFSAHFSASTSYQSQSRDIEKGFSMHVDLLGRATVYHARLAPSTHTYKVSEFFEKAIAALPNQPCTQTTPMEPYENLLRDFGTHFTSDVTMGATSVQRMTLKTSDVNKFRKHGVSASVAAGASGGFFGFSFSASASAGFSTSSSTRDEIKKMDKHVSEFYIGGAPPYPGNETNLAKGSTASLKEWAQTAKDNPAPILYTLLPIEEILTTDLPFSRPIPGLLNKRDCMRQALLNFCQKYATKAESCLNDNRKEKRSKRSTDPVTNVTSNSIKFGDYVSFHNNIQNSDLIFGETRQWASDEASCFPLTAAEKVNRNENIFQVLPVNGQERLLGLPLHYDQVFRLNGIRGKNVILGTQRYKDVTYINKETLEYFFKFRNLETHSYGNNRILCSPDIESSVYIFKLVFGVGFGFSCTRNVSIHVILEGSQRSTSGQISLSSTPSRTVYDAIIGSSVGQLQNITMMLIGRGKVSSSCRPTLQTSIIDVRMKRIYIQQHASGPYRMDPITLDLTAKTVFDQGDITGAMDNSYYAEFSFLSSENKGSGAVVNDDDTGVFHIITTRPRTNQYWGLVLPDMMAVSIDRQVLVQEQMLHNNSYQVDDSCQDRLDFSGDTILSASSGSRSNTSWLTWNFANQDSLKYLQYTFPSLARIIKLHNPTKSNLSVKYLNRNTGKWQTAKLPEEKGTSDFLLMDGAKSSEDKIVSSAIRIFLSNVNQSVDLFNYGLIGCMLGSQGIDIQKAQIPENIKWKINLQDVQPTTDPIFVMAKKSSIPKGHVSVDNADTHKRNIEVLVPLPRNTDTCNIENDTFSKIMLVMMDNPVALFRDFDGSLKSTDGDVVLNLKFEMVSYSDAEADMLKAEALRRLPKSGKFLPCYGAGSQQFSSDGNSGASGILRPVDYFLVIVATIAIIVLLIGAIFFAQQRLRRKRGYTNLDDDNMMHLRRVKGDQRKMQLPVETVLLIVDHVMDKMRQEGRSQQGQEEFRTVEDQEVCTESNIVYDNVEDIPNPKVKVTSTRIY